VTVVELALGRASGAIELYAGQHDDVADAGVRSQYGTGDLIQQVAVSSLDAWAEKTHRDRLELVKLDVEGAEVLVIEGMRTSLWRLRPRAVVVEVSARVLERSGVDEVGLRGLLASCGYRSTGQMFHSNEVFRPADRAS
jgi:hypothetical protein